MMSLILYFSMGALVWVLIELWDRKVRADYPHAPAPKSGFWLSAFLFTIFCASVVAVWPIFLFLQLRDIWAYKSIKPFGNKVFAVTRKDLMYQTSVLEIEQHERVFDPMGAVPNIPFGFLNAAWLRFLAQVGPEDTIWYFSTQWKRGWQMERRSGYVVRQRRHIGPHFLTTRTELD